ncbi:MAG: hypothetical protein PHY64_05140 [Eubacteriales bacterium]|nr:hypothetical protein [Eubacteriales bacterium]
MSKSILLVSRYFAPQNAIGAVRPTKLAKYLTRMGYEVTVLCGKPTDNLRDPLLERDMAEIADVRMVRERSLMRWWKERSLREPNPKALTDRARIVENTLAEADRESASPTAPPAVSATPVSAPAAPVRKNPLFDGLYRWLYHRADAAFARAALREAASMGRHFDIVFSCYGPLSVHTVACAVKRKGLANRWIADFRDEASVPFRWQKRWLARYMHRVRQNADAITSVSHGFLKFMGLETFGEVIPNGYDREDLLAQEPFPVDRDMLSFAYCGQLYTGHSDLTPVFQAVRALIDEGLCEERRIRFHYAGRQGRAFAAQAARFELENLVTDHGLLPRSRSLALQKAANVLLAATWNTAERRGVVTGKLLEYMMADRPVLCCVSGEYGNSDARALMERTRLGAVYEQAQAQKDAPALKAYLLALYQARFSGAPSAFQPDRNAIADFDYTHITELLANLMEKL